MKSLTTLTTLFYFTTVKTTSLTTLTTLFCFIIINIESLTMLNTLFYFTAINMKSLTTLTTLFKSITIKMKPLTALTTMFYQNFMQNVWLHSLRCFTSLLLTRDIALLLLRCPYPSSIFLPWNFSVSIKVVYATVISPSGSSVESYMLYYPHLDVFS